MLKYELVKYNEFNNLIPINDIYNLHYRKKYLCISDNSNPIDHMIWKLTNMLLPKELEDYYEKIHIMRNNEEFQTINYILETVFLTSSLDMYKKHGETNYFIYYISNILMLQLIATVQLQVMTIYIIYIRI